MTAPESRPMRPGPRLEAQYAITAPTVGLTPSAYEDRVKLWSKLAEELGGTVAQQQARVATYALTAAITHLMGQKDKLRAEGDLTMERDILGRIAVLQGWLTDAQKAVADAQPAGNVSANPAPILESWRIG